MLRGSVVEIDAEEGDEEQEPFEQATSRFREVVVPFEGLAEVTSALDRGALEPSPGGAVGDG